MSHVPSDPVVATLRTAGCVFAEDEARLLRERATTREELAAMVARRVAGEPLEYIVGWVEFCGLRLHIEPGVFVPRQRTAFLVERAVALAAPGAVVVDLCCGCGAIGAAIADRVDRVELYASDLDATAVANARRNLPDGRVFGGDLFEPLPTDLRHRVDLVVANVPYVPTEHIALMPAEAREHEPRSALDGGSDGLDILRRVARQAPRWLRASGHLLIETSAEQAPYAARAFTADGLASSVVADDERGATVVIGQTAP